MLSVGIRLRSPGGNLASRSGTLECCSVLVRSPTTIRYTPLIAAYWRTNLTSRQLAPLFSVFKSAADRITDHTAPLLAAHR